jgi:iron complex outermembrane recepter protein
MAIISPRLSRSSGETVSNSLRLFANGVSAGVIAAGLLLGNAAWAQQPASAETASDDNGEIVVTALKREQNIQDVPASVSALSSDLLGKLNAQDFSRVADSVPGVAFATTGVGNSQYIVRGIGSVGAAQSPTTGVYLDETPLQSRALRGASQPDPQLYDIARVEILRGPQGVLFGSSAMGGLVRIVTNQPDATAAAGKVEASASTIKDGSESWDVKAMLNVPIVQDSLALRIVGSIVHQGGWIDDLRPRTTNLTENLANPDAIKKDDNWTEYKTVRAALRWQATPTLTITPSLIFQNAYSNTDRTFSDATFSLHDRLKARYQDTHSKDKFVIGTVLAQNDFEALGGFTLLSTSSYMDRKTGLLFDVTAFRSPAVADIVGAAPNGLLYPVAAQDLAHTEQFTQEVRVVSTSASPLQYVAGLFFRKMDQRSERKYTVTDLLGATAPAPLNAMNPPTLSDANTHFKESEIAAFGELTYAVTEQFKIAAGARVFKYKQRETSSQYGVGGAPGGSLAYAYSEPNKESGITPRFTLTYEPSRVATFYASFSQGFRTGGVNAPITDDVCTAAERQAANLPDTPPPYKSDKTDNFEVGAKTNFLGGKIRINGSAYSIQWKDYQQAFQTTCGLNSANAVSFIVNAGKVRSQGGELEIVVAPVEGLTLQAGASYIDATYRSPVPQLFLPAGSRLLDVPKFSWNARADYSFPVSSSLEGNLFFAARHIGDTISGFGEGEIVKRPAYTLLDLSVGVKTKDDLALDFFINNITDAVPVYGQEFATSPGTTTATSYFAYHVGPPRTIGVRLSKAF